MRSTQPPISAMQSSGASRSASGVEPTTSAKSTLTGRSSPLASTGVGPDCWTAASLWPAESTSIRVAPTLIASPGVRSVGAMMRSPFTQVPFSDPRSWISSPSGVTPKTACARDISGSSRTRPTSSPRPTVSRSAIRMRRPPSAPSSTATSAASVITPALCRGGGARTSTSRTSRGGRCRSRGRSRGGPCGSAGRACGASTR